MDQDELNFEENYPDPNENSDLVDDICTDNFAGFEKDSNPLSEDNCFPMDEDELL